MADAFRSAGFADVREERISVPIVFPTADAAIGAAFIGGSVALPTPDSTIRHARARTPSIWRRSSRTRQGEAYHAPGELPPSSDAPKQRALATQGLRMRARWCQLCRSAWSSRRTAR
jgi:hypothetical protein